MLRPFRRFLLFALLYDCRPDINFRRQPAVADADAVSTNFRLLFFPIRSMILQYIPPPPSFFPLPLAQTPHLTSKSARVINTFTQLISPHFLSRAIHALAAIQPPPPPPTPRPSPPPAPSLRPSTTRIANPYIYAT